jgi:hypothetical protein
MNTAPLHLVKVGSATNSTATMATLEKLAASHNATLEVFKSRRGNHQLIKINGQLVAYGFQTEEEAIAYALTGEAA